MNRKVVINCDDQGQYTVGTEAPVEVREGAPAVAPMGMQPKRAGDSLTNGDTTQPETGNAVGMTPARDLDDALNQARVLLEQPMSEGGGPSPFQRGFDKVRGSPDMGGTAGGLGY